ncbi:hypothetical protein BDV59DRAFT_44854 [Aspergillus ambiguus]|uniref:uncharacterized protein n=1 Tax=Aspergillus ambiguus TaxID=176160 RepID=UPI003CCE45CB
MAHHFYTPDEEVSFDQQSKRDALPMAHPGRGEAPQDVGERGLPCVSPTPELDGKNRNSTRRRIQVACNRCRKRKIKCSGDIGDGQGCSNCRSSGNHNCQFLRVNSSMLQTKVGVWAYPSPNAISQSTRLGLYAPSMAPKSRVLSASSQALRESPYPRASSYDLSSTNPQQQQQPSYSRSPLVDHAISYEDDSPAAYASPSSAYMMPSTPQGVLPDYCGLSWAKVWSPSMAMSRGPPSGPGLFADHEAAEGSVVGPSAAYAYMFPGQGTPSTGGDPGLVPSMALLSEPQGADRTLPTPTTRNQQPIGPSAFAGAPETTVAGLTHAQDYRVGQHWGGKGGVSSNVRAMQSGGNGGPGGAFSTSPGSMRPKPVPSNTQEMVFGYMPLGPVSSCGGFTGLDGVEAGEERLSRSSFSRENGGGRLLALNEYGSDIYGYSSTEGKKCSDAGESGSAATLLNGLPYTRPKHPEHSFPTDGMSDFREAAEVHRAPASALSNAGGF